MARSAIGAVSITDVKDGIHPISMVLSNQSHTFAADTTGAVTTGEKAQFSCELFVYIGDTRATYSTAASPANGTYNVSLTKTDGWDYETSVVSGQLVVKVKTVPTGVTNKTGTITLSIVVENLVGNSTTMEAVISLAKAIEGANGAIVELTPSRQTFQFDEANDSNDGDITIPIRAIGNVGTLSAQYSRNGATSWSALAVGTAANKAKVIDIDGANNNDQIVISKANFGTSDIFTVKVTGGTGGSDIVSIIKIQDGSTGPASLFVSIKSSTQGFIFKNNAGTTKTLTARVYDMKDGSEITSGVTYQWYKNSVSMSGKTSKTLSVTASDVVNGGSDEFSCQISAT